MTDCLDIDLFIICSYDISDCIKFEDIDQETLFSKNL